MSIKFVYPKGWIWNPTHLVLNETTIYDTGKRGVNFMSPDGLFEIKDGIAYAHPGIKWDGTTAVPDGGPDPMQPYYPVSWRASLFHDLGCQYTRESEEFRKYYTRADWNRYFYYLLVSVKFKHAWLYYAGVSFFGTFVIWKTWIRSSWKKYEDK